jgi:hypothetical protein
LFEIIIQNRIDSRFNLSKNNHLIKKKMNTTNSKKLSTEAGKDLTVISGNMRLQASLSVFGRATVLDIDTGESLEVRANDGELVASPLEGKAIGKTPSGLLCALISRAF